MAGSRGHGWRLFLLALLVPAAAGCLDAPAPAAEPAPDASPPEAAPEPTHRPNRFLLDAPRPFSTYVSDGAEPVILADANGDFLLIGDTWGVHRSTDGGRTWTDVPYPWWLLCDGVSLAQDAAGTVYAASTNCGAVQTARSDDGGATWDVLASQPVLDASPIADRPWIGAGAAGDVAVVFYDFGRTFSETCIHSTDRGATWTDRMLVTPPATAGNLVFDAAGNFYHADDGVLTRRPGQCLGLADTLTMLDATGPQVFTQAAAAGDAVYVAAPTENSDGIAIAGTRDFDAVHRLVLHPRDDATGARLFTNTFVTLSATEEEVAVAWYGTEADGDPEDPGFDGSWNVFTARIRGFWTDDPTVTYDRITTAPNHVGEICMGGVGCTSDRDLLDYFMVDHGPDGALHVAYVHDGATSDAETRYAVLPRLPGA